MIKDKKIVQKSNDVIPVKTREQIPEEKPLNSFVEMYQAAKRAILTIKENADDPYSEPFFKTIAIDTGQFNRLIREDNTEFEVALPAVYIHFINVHYLVRQQRIGEGRATMRIRFILNTLNNQDIEKECDPFFVFQKINIAIQDAKNKEHAFNERCSLKYFDMPTTTNMLQAYWVDYEVWFREASAWKYRDWVERYVVIPPFTNHIDAPEHDKNGHGNHKIPVYEEVSKLQKSLEEDSSNLEDTREDDK